MQPTLNKALDPTYLAALHEVVEYATNVQHAYVLLDVHNYMKYRGNRINSASVPLSSIKDLWKRLASEFVDNHRIIFGLMNEPTGLSTEVVLEASQLALDGVREAGAKQLILVSGNGYSGVHSWTNAYYGTPNAEVMGAIVDPENNFAFEMHQYFDAQLSGAERECLSTWNTEARFKPATEWLRENGFKAFLGEFGYGPNAYCYEVAESVLDYIDTNTDVWIGWAYWAAGPKWEPNNRYDIEPYVY